MAKIILFNKPYGVISQFSEQPPHTTLASYIDAPNFYPAGRLDTHSEGLLLLTDDGRLQHQISHPRHKLEKTYWAQVEGTVSEQALASLREGVELKDGLTRPAKARSIEPPDLWPRNPPIRFRANIPTSWIELKISEGRNRQVRRMTAAVDFPTLRLVRVAIGEWSIMDIAPGHYRLLHLERTHHLLTKRSGGARSNNKHSR